MDGPKQMVVSWRCYHFIVS